MNKQSAVQQMLKEADRNLKGARYLYEGQFYNDAVSRAYYCILNTTRALLLTKNETPATHKGVFILFNKIFIKSNLLDQNLKVIINNAANKRSVADYVTGKQITPKETKVILEDAKSFLKEIKDYIKKVTSND